MENLTRIRESYGLSKYALSKTLGSKSNSIERIERGDSDPSVELLEKIADYFGVTTDYLLGRESSVISEEDRQLLERIHSLTTVQKNAVKKMIDTFAKKKIAETRKPRLQLYFTQQR